MPAALPLPAGAFTHKPLHGYSFSLPHILGLKHNSLPWKESPHFAEEKNQLSPALEGQRGQGELELNE